ncbi:MAG: type II-A CRISPR-associated protein Csn2 [Candidatus Ancillula sp.]|jgi:CRISPR type II-A-associated protein Csn2|nr:type II-A CRISPR-associated protein Csn2 [Candidatus Ancillula sp.]
MKLIHKELEFEFDFENNYIYQCVIKNPHFYRTFISAISGADESDCVELVDKEKMLTLSTCIYCLTNPFDIDFKDRKIINKIYSNFNELAISSEMEAKTFALRSTVSKYLDSLIANSEEMIEYSFEDDFTIDSLLKAVGFSVDLSGMSFLERLEEYTKLLIEKLKYKIICFVNLGSFLNLKEYNELAEYCNDNEYNVIFFDSSDLRIKPNFAKRILVTEDLAEVW